MTREEALEKREEIAIQSLREIAFGNLTAEEKKLTACKALSVAGLITVPSKAIECEAW